MEGQNATLDSNIPGPGGQCSGTFTFTWDEPQRPTQSIRKLSGNISRHGAHSRSLAKHIAEGDLHLVVEAPSLNSVDRGSAPTLSQQYLTSLPYEGVPSSAAEVGF